MFAFHIPRHMTKWRRPNIQSLLYANTFSTRPRLFNAQVQAEQTDALQISRTQVSKNPNIPRTPGVKSVTHVSVGALQAALQRYAEKSPFFLRDACQCTACVDPSSGQRDFDFTEIPLNIQATNVGFDVGTGEWKVTWENDIPGHVDHVSTYPRTMIEQLLLDQPVGLRGERILSLWNARTFEAETKEITYEDLLKNPTTLSETLKLISMHGLVFISNVPRDEKAAMNLVTRLTGLYRNTFYGQSWDVRSVPQAKNVAYTSKVLDFHMDLLYMKEPPGLQILHCLENSCTGGESEFVDAYKALDYIHTERPDYTGALSTPQFKIRYGYNNDPHFYSDNKSVVKFKPVAKRHEPHMLVRHARDHKFIEAIDRVYWSPPFINSISSGLEHHFSDTNPSYRNFLQAAKYFAKSLRRDGCVYETKLPAGTCAVFDNLRVLHARKAFDVNSGKRWLKGVYGDAQDLRSMTRKHVWEKSETSENPMKLHDRP